MVLGLGTDIIEIPRIRPVHRALRRPLPRPHLHRRRDCLLRGPQQGLRPTVTPPASPPKKLPPKLSAPASAAASLGWKSRSAVTPAALPPCISPVAPLPTPTASESPTSRSPSPTSAPWPSPSSSWKTDSPPSLSPPKSKRPTARVSLHCSYFVLALVPVAEDDAVCLSRRQLRRRTTRDRR